MQVTEDVVVLDNGDAKFAITMDFPESELADKFRSILAAPSDAVAGVQMPIPEGNDSCRVHDDFVKSVVQEQKCMFGFTAQITELMMVPRKVQDGGLNVLLRGSVTFHVLNITAVGQDGIWDVAIYPTDEGQQQSVSEVLWTKLMFAKMMLESIEDEQVYQANWKTRIMLPEGAAFLNTAEIDGHSWNIDFGGGTYMNTQLRFEENSVVLDETTVVAEQNYTKTPEQIYADFCQYKNARIKYLLPNSAQVGIRRFELGLLDDWSWEHKYTIEKDYAWHFDLGGGEYANMTATLKFSITPGIGWHFHWFKLMYFGTGFVIHFDINVNVSGRASGNHWNLAEQSWDDEELCNLEFSVCCIPIKINVILETFGNLKIDLPAGTPTDFDVRLHGWIHFKASVNWASDCHDPHGWFHQWEYNKGGCPLKTWFGRDKVTCKLEAGPRYYLGLYLYSTFGPYVGFSPYGTLTYEHDAEESYELIDSAFYIGIFAGCRLRGRIIEWLGLEKTWEFLKYNVLTLYHTITWVGQARTQFSLSLNEGNIHERNGIRFTGQITCPHPGKSMYGTVNMEFQDCDHDPGVWKWFETVRCVTPNEPFTGSKGVFDFYWVATVPPLLGSGTYQFRGLYEGNEWFKPSESNPVNLTIVDPPPRFVAGKMLAGAESEKTERASRVFHAEDENIWVYTQCDPGDQSNNPEYIEWNWTDPDDNVFRTTRYTLDPLVNWTGEAWESLSIAAYTDVFDDYYGRPFHVLVWEYRPSTGYELLTTMNFVVEKLPSLVRTFVSPGRTIDFGESVVLESVWYKTFLDRGDSAGTSSIEYSVDRLNWTTLAQGTPDGTGSLSYEWTPLHAGNYSYRSRWSGNETYQGSTDYFSWGYPLIVNKVETSLSASLNETSIVAGRPVNITATMTPAVEGKAVSFWYSLNNSEWSLFDLRATNASGVSSIEWIPQNHHAGNCLIRAYWAGDEDYVESTSDNQTLEVTAAETKYVPAEITLDPDTWTPTSNETELAVYIEIPPDNGVTELDASASDSVSINCYDTDFAPLSIGDNSSEFDPVVGDFDGDSIVDMKSFFNKTEIESFLNDNMSVCYGTIMLNVSGSLSDGTLFQEEVPLRLARALIAVNDIIPSKTVVGSGFNTSMNVTAQSQGLPVTGPLTLYATAESTNNGLVGYWGFDEGTGTIAHDNSGFENHGNFSFEEAWEWQTTGDLEGWTAAHDIANLQCDGTSIKGVTTGDVPNLDSPSNLAIDASVAKTIHLRMNVTNASYPARIYFITAADPVWGSDKSAFFALREAGQWNEYRVDVSGIPGWNGTITQIRLVPSCAPGGVAFSFDWIRIGGNPKWTDGRFSSALDFDGLDDVVEAPFIPLNDRSFTVTAWLNARSLPSFPVDAGILRQCDTPSAGKYLHIAIRNYHVYFGFYGDDLTSDSALITNTWYHIACVYNYSNNRKSIYINGILDHEGSSLSPYKGTSGHTEIGYSGCFFNGTLDEVRIYDQALTEEAVKAVASSGAIQTLQVTLEGWESANLTFTWNTSGWAKGNYTVSAYAWPVSGERGITDNIFSDGAIHVSIPGDVDPHDGYVGIDDIFSIASHFGQDPSSPTWNPNCDVNGDEYVGIDDIFIAASHFGQEENP